MTPLVDHAPDLRHLGKPAVVVAGELEVGVLPADIPASRRVPQEVRGEAAVIPP